MPAEIDKNVEDKIFFVFFVFWWNWRQNLKEDWKKQSKTKYGT